MIKSIATAAMAILIALPVTAYSTTPQEDQQAFQEYFMKRFPDTPFSDFKNGVYSIDAASREQWEDIEEFAPYELNLSNGEELFNKPFANGKTYASCFDNGGIGIRQNYPYFDTVSGKIKTLELEINECRLANNEKPLKWKSGRIADISAYMAFTSRGKKFNITVPDDSRALAAYNRGKQLFYTKQGQLNLACADCHVNYAGNKLRAEILSPALGHLTHFPTYRSQMGNMSTTHRRYAGCFKQVRAKVLKAQSTEYRALEYFQTYMSNGLQVNGPGSRK